MHKKNCINLRIIYLFICFVIISTIFGISLNKLNANGQNMSLVDSKSKLVKINDKNVENLDIKSLQAWLNTLSPGDITEYKIKDDVNIENFVVSITPGKYWYYDSWFTTEFDVANSNGIGGHSMGFCIQPNKPTPTGQFEAVDLDNNELKTLCVLWYSLDHPDIKNEFLSKGINPDNYFIYLETPNHYGWAHALMAYYYSGDSTGLNPSSIDAMNAFRPLIGQTYNVSSDVINKFRLMYAPNSTQSICWVTDALGGIQMNKKSKLYWSEINPNYSYENNDCVYSIYKDSECNDWTGINMTIDSNGHGQTSINALMEGTYYVREDKTNHGINYQWNNEIGSVYVKPGIFSNVIWPSSQNETTYDVPISDISMVSVQKADQQTINAQIPESKASFENAYYDFEFYTDYFNNIKDIESHKSSYQRHWLMSTNSDGQTGIKEMFKDRKIQGDDFYYNENQCITCPLGSYVIHETKAPLGYCLSTKTYIIQITVDSQHSDFGVIDIVFDADTGEQISIIEDENYFIAYEQVFRGDYKFIKEDFRTQRPMDSIPWKITSKSTGEWHVVVTDKNGEVNTNNDICSHMANTNYFDCLLDENGEIPKQGIDESIIKNFMEKGEQSGTWFCWDDKKHKYVKPSEKIFSDKIGAFPYDTYILEELPVSSNKSYNLVVREFDISCHNRIVDGGIIYNMQYLPNIETSAYNQDTGDKTYYISDNENLIDVVDYSGLEISREYTLCGILMDKNLNQPIKDKDDKVIQSEIKFVPKSENGQQTVNFSLNTVGLDNTSIVVYEYLYDDNKYLLAKHDDLESWSQTLNPKKPLIKTLLTNVDGGKDINIGENIVLKDVIRYENIKPNLNYEVYGEVLNYKTSEYISFVKKEITLDNSSGYIEVEFNVSTLDLSDTDKLVAFESLKLNNQLVVAHADKECEDQTVDINYPSVDTFFHDYDTDTQDIIFEDKINVSDTVNIKNLVKGQKYKINGVLLDKDSGKELRDLDGNIVKQQLEFVADSEEQSQEINFNFNYKNLGKTQQIVAYEKIFIGDKEIANHEDINSQKQTISLKYRDDAKSEINTTNSPKTSDLTYCIVLFLFISFLLLSIVMLIWKIQESIR